MNYLQKEILFRLEGQIDEDSRFDDIYINSRQLEFVELHQLFDNIDTELLNEQLEELIQLEYIKKDMFRITLTPIGLVIVQQERKKLSLFDIFIDILESFRSVRQHYIFDIQTSIPEKFQEYGQKYCMWVEYLKDRGFLSEDGYWVKLTQKGKIALIEGTILT